MQACKVTWSTCSSRLVTFRTMLFPDPNAGPPEPPEPRTTSWKAILPAFSIGAGTMLVLSRLEEGLGLRRSGLTGQDKPALQLEKLLDVRSALGACLILSGVTFLIGQSQRTVAVRFGVVVVGLVSLVAFRALGWTEGWGNKLTMLMFLVALIVASRFMAKPAETAGTNDQVRVHPQLKID